MKEIGLTLIISAITVAVMWGVFTEKVVQLEAKAMVVEEAIKQKDQQYSCIREELAKITTDLQWIRENMKEGR